MHNMNFLEFRILKQFNFREVSWYLSIKRHSVTNLTNCNIKMSEDVMQNQNI